MKLSGEATLNASVAAVYAALNDPAVLVRTIPGCQRLDQVGEDSYRATIVAGVASIKGTFDGDVRLTDQDAPHSFTLHASGVGAPGTVNAVARVTLVEADGATHLTYDADAAVGGVIGGVGQRMITGVARKTAGEFFAAVDRELTVRVPSPVAVPTARGETDIAVLDNAGPSAGSGANSADANVTAATGSDTAAGAASGAGRVWMAPAPVLDAGRQRIRDLMVGAAFGAIVALLGVLVGAIVAGW